MAFQWTIRFSFSIGTTYESWLPVSETLDPATIKSIKRTPQPVEPVQPEPKKINPDDLHDGGGDYVMRPDDPLETFGCFEDFYRKGLGDRYLGG